MNILLIFMSNFATSHNEYNINRKTSKENNENKKNGNNEDEIDDNNKDEIDNSNEHEICYKNEDDVATIINMLENENIDLKKCICENNSECTPTNINYKCQVCDKNHYMPKSS
jgi:predicted membrane protein